jgi:flagellin
MTRVSPSLVSTRQSPLFRRRAVIGAVQNRLGFSIGFTEVEIENITASDATIRDADMALEVTEFTRAQLLLQTSNAMLVQANVTSIGALSLL